MNKKTLLAIAIATAIGISAVANPALSAPLPAGTKLTITPWVRPPAPDYNLYGCTYEFGSCFAVYVVGGSFPVWTAIEPGTDGGLIIGKPQKSGGQEVDRTSTNSGELTAMWDWSGNHGTFFTAPSDAGNVFDDASCVGSACGSNTTPRLTDLAVWNWAFVGLTAPVGSATGCDKAVLSNCTADMVAGIFVKSWTIDPPGTMPRNYELKYSQVMSALIANSPISLILRGTVEQQNQAPVVTVTPDNLIAVYGAPAPFTITVTDPDGPNPPTRRSDSPYVQLNDCIGGTYTGQLGFVGTDGFNIIANDGLIDSQPALVYVAVTAPTTSPTPTPTTSVTPPVTPTPTVIVDGCAITYPIKQTTLTGKQGHLTMTVTGNIISVNPNGKEIKICPTTTITYEASTTTPGATVVCKVKNNTSRGKGRLKVNDHIKCTDRPVGNDKIHVKIKSGVSPKTM